ncbi:hypothetical protein U1Q18_034419 [Sarracenia purpurea var. burkii]
MSAGYDGKTIVWDIWEGTPIRTYEIGRFKLVDGKFSPDGTSIVLSDEAGQIYLLNTGQGESQKDAKYDQFFLGDYRPLVQDPLGNFLDQETQLAPYRRNIQDSLCDSSMIPYPEPYQSMYQRRRLGALGIEWRPSSIKFTIGTDIGLGHELLPLADLDRVIEPLPEIIDAMYWDLENEVLNDDTDSEYNVTEEYSSDGEQGILNSSCSSDPESGEEDNLAEDGLRRSRRRKHKVKLMTSSGRCVKRRNLDDHDGTSSRTRSAKKQRSGRKTSKRKSVKAKALRPQRVAARNAMNLFSRITGASTDEHEGSSEDDSSESEIMMQDSNMQSNEGDYDFRNVQMKDSKAEQVSLRNSEDVIKPPVPLEPRLNIEKKGRLVLKLQFRDFKKSAAPENTIPQIDNHANLASSSSSPIQENTREHVVNLISEDPGLSSANAYMTNEELSENCNRTDFRDRDSEKVEGHLESSVGDKESKIRWGEVKRRTSIQMKSDLLPRDASSGFNASFDAHEGNKNDVPDPSEFQFSCPSSQIQDYEGKLLNGACKDEDQFETGQSQNMDGSRNNFFSTEDVHKSSLCDFSPLSDHHQVGIPSALTGDRSLREEYKDFSESDICRPYDLAVVTNHPKNVENPPLKPIKLRIKSKIISRDPECPSQLEFSNPVNKLILGEEDEGCDQPSFVQRLRCDSNRKDDNAGYRGVKSNWCESNPEGYSVDLGEDDSKATSHNHDSGIDLCDAAATDAIRRTRSMRLKATSPETVPVNDYFKVRQGIKSAGTSKRAEKFSKKIFDQPPLEEWMTSPKTTISSRSRRNKGGVYYDNDQSSSAARKSQSPLGMPNWLTLSQQEEGYRYIPQLGDEVVYLRQGHQEYLESMFLSEVPPWVSIKKNIRAVEFCSVKRLDYSTVPGSADSCCKITLKFTDPSSSVLGEAFRFTLPELKDFPDFVVERTRYDAAIGRNWSNRDKCLVWWKDENEQGGSWWEGRIMSSNDKSNEFPGSPWERYSIQYKDDCSSSHLHSPWELHDLEIPWEHPHIDDETRDELLSSFNHLHQSVSKYKDRYGILILNQAAQKEEFVNRFPAPLSPDLIIWRLKNNYYRSLKAVRHDMNVIVSNAQAYFEKNPEVGAKMKRLSEWFNKTLSNLY